MARLLRKFSSSIQPVLQTLASTFLFLKVQCTNNAKFRDPYLFFLRVVSWASKPDSIMYLPIFNLGCPEKSAELYKLKRMVKKLRATWTFLISIYSRYSYHERVLTKLLSTTGYRRRLNIAYLCVTSSHHGWSVYHEGKMVTLPFPPYKAAAPASPFCETSSKKGHIFFFSPKATKRPLQNARSLRLLTHFLRMVSECSTSKKREPFVENAALSKMAPKLMISLQTKAACYSPFFKSFN